jgi:hypothetical protein
MLELIFAGFSILSMIGGAIADSITTNAGMQREKEIELESMRHDLQNSTMNAYSSLPGMIRL